MSQWKPRATVACIVERDGRYLMVEERDKRSGEMVFNQPAGHLEDGESLESAALRETLEETGWIVELQSVVSIALYRPPERDDTYFRTTFLARAVSRDDGATLDPDIHAVHWLEYGELQALSGRMRSPIVLAVIEQYRQGNCHPLDLIYHP